MSVDGPGISFELISPDFIQQLVSRQDFSTVTDELYQQFELRRRQVSLFAIYEDNMSIHIHSEAVALQDRFQIFNRNRSSKHCPDPQNQLPWTEGLYYVVVRSQLQADDAVDFLAARRQHDDRNVFGFSASF